jgi:hypothetical protein
LRQSPAPKNAVARYCAGLSRVELAQLVRRLRGRDAPVGRATELCAILVERFELDLAGLLNLATRAELDAIARAIDVPERGTVGELRARLWTAGAEREAGGRDHFGSPLQPMPIVLGGKLVHPAAGGGIAPPSPSWPRPVGDAADAPVPAGEPDSIEQLLDNADALVGVRFGEATRDKGAFGAAIAAALGVVERGAPEPDWRGEVEIKTVPVIADRSGWWRVKEDPAVGMAGGAPERKLGKVLWIARVADRDDSPVLSWYYQEADARVRRLLERDLHTRPKGGAGATTRGWYVHKRFFTDSGFLRSLNG